MRVLRSWIVVAAAAAGSRRVLQRQQSSVESARTNAAPTMKKCAPHTTPPRPPLGIDIARHALRISVQHKQHDTSRSARTGRKQDVAAGLVLGLWGQGDVAHDQKGSGTGACGPGERICCRERSAKASSLPLLTSVDPLAYRRPIRSMFLSRFPAARSTSWRLRWVSGASCALVCVLGHNAGVWATMQEFDEQPEC